MKTNIRFRSHLVEFDLELEKFRTEVMVSIFFFLSKIVPFVR